MVGGDGGVASRWVRSSIAGAFASRSTVVGVVAEEVVATEAGVALTALRVEDPEGRPLPRRAVAVAGDQRLGPLADDVAPEPDPRPPGELEAEAGRLGDGGREATGETRRLEDDEERLRATGERRQPAEPVGDPGGLVRGGEPAAGQVEDEHVRRAAGQQHAADGEPLVERLRGDDHEPVEPDAAGDRLDRVEAARQVEPGDDRALRLGLGGEPEDERGPAARPVAADRDAGRPRQAAGPEDGVERREPRVDDAVVRGRGGRRGRCLVGFGTGTRLGAVAGARASAPSVILGAAAPQRAWRLATAAVTSGERVAIGRLD